MHKKKNESLLDVFLCLSIWHLYVCFLRKSSGARGTPCKWESKQKKGLLFLFLPRSPIKVAFNQKVFSFLWLLWQSVQEVSMQKVVLQTILHMCVLVLCVRITPITQNNLWRKDPAVLLLPVCFRHLLAIISCPSMLSYFSFYLSWVRKSWDLWNWAILCLIITSVVAGTGIQGFCYLWIIVCAIFHDYLWYLIDASDLQ